MFVKIGQYMEVTPSMIQSAESVEKITSDDKINAKFAKSLAMRKLTPTSKDFLYFSTRYITAAEASLINEDGSPKLDRHGKPVTAHWDRTGDSMKWVCSDPSIKPYKNQNGDIFPEEELLKAHRKWVERPLCIDHRSDSVDAVRGIILDSFYDQKRKYAVALIALDRVQFPDLARGIEGKYKTSVSMGTRVAAAVCYDCGQVAKTERDFCNHMKTKSSYGEINTGLDPIEISIVVSGADPQAKIRTILAHTNKLKNSLQAKESELNGMIGSPVTQKSLAHFEELQNDIKNISEKLSVLKASMNSENISDLPVVSEEISGIQESKEVISIAPDTTSSLMSAVASNNNALRSELEELKNSVSSKFQDMEKSLQTLSHKIKEEIMSVNSKDSMNKSAYFQGGGGVNEPTPHQVKYPKEPLNEQLREKGDKHMLTEDLGPVDGLAKDDLAKKKLLQRANLQERALRRAAKLEKIKENHANTKSAYFQGGGGVNEPTPGKPKYEVDPLNEKAREEDKHMVGKKPFPDVGAPDELFPGDLEKKQLMNRASLKAKFVRIASEQDGSEDMGQSGWQVSRDNEVLFTATVEEISGGNVDGLYDVIASKDFAKKMLDKVYKLGADKAKALYKGAQAVTGMETAPVAPELAGGAAPAPEMPVAPAAEAPVATDAQGDPKEVAIKLAEEMRDRASDLLEAIRALTGEQSEMSELEELGATASDSTFSKLVSMKKKLASGLISDMKKTVANLNDAREDLAIVTDILEDGSISGKDMENTVRETFSEASVVVAQAYECMDNCVKYVQGSEQLAKKAQLIQHQMEANKVEDTEVDAEKVEDKQDAYDLGMAEDADKEETKEDEDMNQVMLDVDPASLQGKKVEIKAASDLSTKEGRAELRAKLAAKAVEFSPILDEAHKLTDGDTKFDVKPTGNLGRIETIEEKHQVMLDIAEAPPKVRKEASRLNDLILSRKVAVADLDTLVSKGLDASVVQYWKKFYGQAGKDGSEFASELLKEHAKAQFDEEISKYKVKLARAYELTNEMVRRGLVADERAAISAHVEDVMTWNDEGFESMKRVVAKHSLRKSASALPQVGLFVSDDAAPKTANSSLQDELDSIWSTPGSTRRF